MTPAIDSICQTTLEYVRIKNLLLRQQERIGKEVRILENSINALTLEQTEILNERQNIENELRAINRHLDSITPKRPEGPRPKENIIDILNERLSFHGSYGLNINQLNLSNWAAGGESSWAGKAFANFSLIYRKKKFERRLVGAFAFGISRFADKRIEKQDDKIDLTYALVLSSKKQWNLSFVATFNTQFANGYKYPNDSTIISAFFAPAYLTLSAGYTYKTKNEHFQIFLSPAAGKITFVTNQDLADQGAFGVKKGYYDQDSVWIPGENVAPALGVNVIINYKQPIGKIITYTTMLNAFYNYIERRNDNRLRLDVNWENTVNFTISKFLVMTLFIHLKYDHNTTFPVYETIEGVETLVDNVPKLQYKESVGIGFIHKSKTLKMNILVTGCKGQLGTELQKIAGTEHHWFFTDIDTLDICNKNAVEDCFEANQIDVCINCAAYTAVDKAEDEPQLATLVNTFAPKVLAEACLKHNALLMHVSTDYVFGGDANKPYKVDDPINPQSVYGGTKADGERVIRESGCNYMIVRTAWLYSSVGKNFVKTMLMLGDMKDEINVVADQKGCPTWAHDLAVALMALLSKNGKESVHETFHFTNEGQITWYDFATAIMEIGGKSCKVNPITTDQYPTKAKRPAYSVLDLSKIKEYAGIEIPNWKDSLEKCIIELTNLNQ